MSSLDPRLRNINDTLAEEPSLAAYPYTFRVLEIVGGTARVSSPRSAELSAIQGLRAMYPELRGESAISDRMQAAQEDLARHQELAQRLVLRHPDVKRIEWVLDEKWLAANGVQLM
jgi:hypothetical protein